MGDYKFNTNPLLRNSLVKKNAPLTFSGKPITRFKHRECLGDVITSPTAGLFSYKVLDFNPSNA